MVRGESMFNASFSCTNPFGRNKSWHVIGGSCNAPSPDGHNGLEFIDDSTSANRVLYSSCVRTLSLTTLFKDNLTLFIKDSTAPLWWLPNGVLNVQRKLMEAAKFFNLSLSSFCPFYNYITLNLRRYLVSKTFDIGTSMQFFYPMHTFVEY